MLVNKYLILYSGDKILMQSRCFVIDKNKSQDYCNTNLKDQIKIYPKDIRDTASHIEFIACHEDDI
jgi:hypothetical protein